MFLEMAPAELSEIAIKISNISTAADDVDAVAQVFEVK